MQFLKRFSCADGERLERRETERERERERERETNR